MQTYQNFTNGTWSDLRASRCFSTIVPEVPAPKTVKPRKTKLPQRPKK